jgi:hypothetical protein
MIPLSACFALVALWPRGDTPPALAIERVALVSMESELVLREQTVLVRAGRIAALGPSAEIELPPDVQRIDGSGRWLMPGLADMHVHAWDENDLLLYVANGVTTVRNMSGAPLQLGWRARIEAGELRGPRIHSAGPIIDGEPPVWPGSRVLLAGEGRAERLVREQREAGYDFLKPYARLEPAAYAELAQAARAQNVPLMGHVPDALPLSEVLAAGQRTIEHLGGFARAAQPADSPYEKIDFTNEAEAWTLVSDARLAELAQAVRAAGTWNCPTLIVLHKWTQGEEAEILLARPEMRFVSPFTRSGWSPRSPFNYLRRMPREAIAAARASVAHRQRAVRALRDAGAGLLLGTDTGNPYVVAGFALHEELGLLVAAGLTPYEALRAGTAEAARCLGGEADWGTLGVGKRADMLLLEANPLLDVRHAARRVGLVLAGRWLPEDELQRELEQRASGFETPSAPASAKPAASAPSAPSPR